jgi:hypothetical protein
MARCGFFRFSGCAVFVAFGTMLEAQTPTGPTAYSLTVHYEIAGPEAITKIYKLGPKVLVDRTVPPSETYGNWNSTHSRILINLETKQSLRWNPVDASAPCVRSTFRSEDHPEWRDPFVDASDLGTTDMKQVGTATILGFRTRILQSTDDRDFPAKVWVDPETGLVLKAMFISPDSDKGKTIVEVTDVSLKPPLPSVFDVPAQCDAFQVIPETAKQPEGNSEQAGALGKFAWKATVGPASKEACSMRFRVLGRGLTEWNTAMTSGIQVAVDLSAATEPAPHYSVRLDDKGHATFSGGELHEIAPDGSSGIYHLDNVPDRFVIDVEFGRSGSASAMVYRQCFAPQSVLQYTTSVDDLQNGGTWEWVKPGLYPGLYPNDQH